MTNPTNTTDLVKALSVAMRLGDAGRVRELRLAFRAWPVSDRMYQAYDALFAQALHIMGEGSCTAPEEAKAGEFA